MLITGPSEQRPVQHAARFRNDLTHRPADAVVVGELAREDFGGVLPHGSVGRDAVALFAEALTARATDAVGLRASWYDEGLESHR